MTSFVQSVYDNKAIIPANVALTFSHICGECSRGNLKKNGLNAKADRWYYEVSWIESPVKGSGGSKHRMHKRYYFSSASEAIQKLLQHTKDSEDNSASFLQDKHKAKIKNIYK